MRGPAFESLPRRGNRGEHGAVLRRVLWLVSVGHGERMADALEPPIQSRMRLTSLLQRIRPRRSSPGQDGDTRAPVLIKLFGVVRRFQRQAS